MKNWEMRCACFGESTGNIAAKLGGLAFWTRGPYFSSFMPHLENEGRPSFYQYTYPALRDLFNKQGLSVDGTRLLYNWHYKQHRNEACEHHNLARKTQEFLRENLSFDLPEIESVKESQDKTVKFLFRLHDGGKVESVLIPFQGKYTLCLSSQVGCAMNCAFCFTGKMGFNRHLRTEEIIGQFRGAQSWLSKHRPDDNRILNLVYMGQGEPLHNFEAVRDSAQIFLSQYGMSLAGHRVTISTSGYIPGLERWVNEMPDVNLALSLHSPVMEKRNQLIPINRRYPLQDVLRIIDQIPLAKKRFVTYEYLLLRDFNDGPEDAHLTGELLKSRKALINLIPFNPFPEARFQRPSNDRVMAFKQILDDYKIPTFVRGTKGDEILAACGQLNTKMTRELEKS